MINVKSACLVAAQIDSRILPVGRSGRRGKCAVCRSRALACCIVGECSTTRWIVEVS